MDKILFGCVAFNNPDDIGSWLNEISAFASFGKIRVAICDNSTNNEDSRRIHQVADSKRAAYYREPENPGYFAGLNRILRENPGYDYYVLGNSDVSYDANFVKILIDLHESDDIAVIAPRIINPSGVDLNPYCPSRPNSFEKTLVHIAYFNVFCYIAYAILSRTKIVHALIYFFGRQSYWQKQKTNAIWAAHGACFVLTKVFMKKCYALPAITFLWFEETLLAMLVESKKTKIVYEERLLLRHIGGATIRALGWYQRYKMRKESFDKYINFASGIKRLDD